MTQNKKKGIAKKALSISLVAAMLATSNVPAWASGFEAVGDGAEFTLESEAPESVEATEDTPVVAATERYDFSKVAVNPDFTWGDDVNLFTADSVVKKADGSNVTTEVKFDVLLDGVLVAGSTAEVSTLATAAVTTTKNDIGLPVTVRFYEPSDEKVTLFTASLTVKAKDIAKDASIDAIDDQKYTGKAIEVVPTVTATASGVAATDFIWHYSATGVNAGSTVTVTGTLKSDKAEDIGYDGTITAAYDIVAQDALTIDNVDITVNNKNAGEYTGAAVTLDPSAVTVKLKDTDVVLPVKEVVTAGVPEPSASGAKPVKITLDTKALNDTKNFDLGADVVLQPTGDEYNVTVTALNLNNVTISPVTKTVSGFTGVSLTDLTIKNAKGEEINLTDKVVVTLENFSSIATTYNKAGTYTGVINVKAIAVASGATVYVTGEKNADLILVDKGFTDPQFLGTEKAFVSTSKSGADKAASVKPYNGKAIEFDLGDFSPNGQPGHDQKGFTFKYDNNVNATGDKQYATLTVTGNAGTEYANCSQTFYFKIAPATVANVNETANSNVKTGVSKDLKGVEQKDSYSSAADYKNDIKLALSATSTNKIDGKDPVFAMTEGSDYTVDYSYVAATDDTKIPEGTDENQAGQYVKAVATLKNANYAAIDKTLISIGNDVKAKSDAAKNTVTVYVPIVAKSIAGATVTLSKDTFVYTGANITPEVTVVYDGKTLKEGKDYSVSVRNGINAGTATVAVTALAGNTAGLRENTKIEKEFTITKANAADVVVKFTAAAEYDGNPQKPAYTATLSGNDVTGQFIAKWGENINAGKTAGKLTLTPKKAYADNYEGIKEAEFEIKGKDIEGDFEVYDELGKEITFGSLSYPYSGSPVTFAKVKFTATQPSGVKLVEGKDYEIVYVDNADAGTAYVCVVGKGNYAADGTKDFTAADGTKIENVVAKKSFTITGTELLPKHITAVKNGVYVSGLVVKPEVTVVVNGKTLTEGKDYKLEYDSKEAINATTDKEIPLTVKGIGAYQGAVAMTADGKSLSFAIDKFDFKNAKITAVGDKVTVMNGSVVVPSSEYTIVKNEDGTLTVKATEGNKNYTGEQVVEGSKAPAATTLKVTDRTTSAVSLSWDKVEGAEGYTIWFRSEHDSSVSRKIINGGDVTKWTQKGLAAGTKYFYTIKSWVKTDAGYVFSEQSETQRGTTKPMAAKITSATASNGKIKVKLAGKASGADMYSMCYADSRSAFAANNFKVGIRTSYTTRTLDKTFSKGTYYVCVKSYRDLGNGSKVYGAWSNTFKVVVK